ncbi:hypothetical protein NOCA1120438 [metagenome]|uniref:Uncharacterized protein n=1 Tax=metagenome TaxID=256318 RepID=A0A2P2C5F3_9ZZZZ
MTAEWLAEVIEDVEEEFDACAIVGLYQFTWCQNIGSRPDEHDLIVARAHEAYNEFLRRHPDAWLGWITWPGMKPELARPAGPDTELDFLLDWTTPSSADLLVLVDGND